MDLGHPHNAAATAVQGEERQRHQSTVPARHAHWDSNSRSSSVGGLILAGTVAAVTIGWALAALVDRDVRFVIYAPAAKAGVEVILGFGSLFAALVLALFPDEGARARLRWVAAGFVILGIGGLLLGYVEPLLNRNLDPNEGMYEALIVRTTASALFMIGLLPRTERRLSDRAMAAIGLIVVLALVTDQLWLSHLPNLTTVANLQESAETDLAILHGLTLWHWILAPLPLGIGILAAIGAALHYPGRALGGWLVIAMTLQSGALLHNLFWPTAYSPIFTTASVIRLVFTAVVLAGALVELRRIAAERQASLAAGDEYARRLTELARIRADFTSMVVHEVGSPLAAIRMLSRALGDESLSRAQISETARTIGDEAGVLEALFRDAQAAAMVEREDFGIEPGNVSLHALFADVTSFSTTLPGDHPCQVDPAPNLIVIADRERIGQVLRNLISNAAKFSDPQTPIAVRAELNGSRVRVMVEDRGIGIPPEDLVRIFEKFGRGRSVTDAGKPGVGLGLYLSRRILQLHGSDIQVRSIPGEGSVFWFELELAR